MLSVRAGLSDMNTFRYGSLGLETSVVPMKSGRGIIVVKSFKNENPARTYLLSFEAAKTLLREYKPGEYQTFVISASNYRKMIHDGNVVGYLTFFKQHY